MTGDGLPPHDVAAEEAVLAALLLDEDAYPRVLPIIQPGDFFREQNGWIYEACLALSDRGDAVTIPTVAHELERAGRLDAAGGEPYLAEIAGKYLTAVGVEAHARIVARDAYYRRLIGVASQVAQLAYEGGADAARVYAHTSSLVAGLRPPETSDIFVQAGGPYVEPPTGPAWGVPVLDTFTGGIVGGELLIIGGHTSEGKSMAAAQIARSAAARGIHTAVLSFEMKKDKYDLRMMSAMVGVRVWPRPAHDDAAALDAAGREIATWPLVISEQPKLTLAGIEAACRRRHAEHGLDLVIVDYLQLIQLPPGKESEATKIGMVTTGLKALARELDCQVVLISQFNRAHAGELRTREGIKQHCLITEKKYPVPYVEGLKGSSSVEQDADAILVVQKHWDCDPEPDGRKHMEVILLKNRNGPTGSCFALEDFSRCRFDWLTQEEIAHVARGDVKLYRALMRDQGYYTERDDYPAPQEPEQDANAPFWEEQ